MQCRSGTPRPEQGFALLNIKPDAVTYLDAERAEIAPHIPAECRTVLDVGCWRGAFGQYLKQQRPWLEVWGIDSSSEAVRHAEIRLDHFLYGDYPEVVPDLRFDCIVFNDVLEHMVDPWTALSSAIPLLAKGGRVVASIPNVRHYSVLRGLALQGDWRYADCGLLDRTHLRFFTRKSMVRLFDQSGFTVREIEPVNMSTSDRLGSIVRRFPRLAAELLFLQYVVVAEPIVCE